MMHRPKVKRWATCWAVVCDGCARRAREWHWDFPSQAEAMRYAIVHAELSRTYGPYVSPALWFEASEFQYGEIR